MSRLFSVFLYDQFLNKVLITCCIKRNFLYPQKRKKSIRRRGILMIKIPFRGCKDVKRAVNTHVVTC
ncbi:hypothetical protein CpB0284 [Chlamydia pneumoniae TW-183]|uniref:Uncharacterized protein n=1 Tax=Chlamydia pneumoniae TaxID=83558 RepID=A0ABM5LCD7_CHLPN|nr:hypothetical protein CpB0284 [Chlamydia pneumoniae TW-183]